MARQLTGNRARANYFEICVRKVPGEARTVCHWMLSELLRVQNENRMDQETLEVRIPPEHLSLLLREIKEGKISGKIGKDVLDIMAESGKTPAMIIEEEKLVEISDSSRLEELVAELLAKHPDDVAEYRSGKTKILGFFIGQVMRETQGKANPKMVNEFLRKKLAEG